MEGSRGGAEGCTGGLRRFPSPGDVFGRRRGRGGRRREGESVLRPCVRTQEGARRPAECPACARGFAAAHRWHRRAPRGRTVLIRRATHRIKRASSSQAEDHTRDRLADVIETYRIKHLPKPEEDSPEKQVRKRRHSWPRSRANFSFS